MTITPLRLTLFTLLTALIVWFAFDQVRDERDVARSERDSAQFEASGLREAARITGERLATAAANDIKHTQELSNVRKRNQALRDSVLGGGQRLLVQASCTTSADVRAGAGAAGLADAGTAELTADARQNYFTLLDQLDLSRQMILGLQDQARLCQR